MGEIRKRVVDEKNSDVDYYNQVLLETIVAFEKIEQLIDELESIDAPVPTYMGRNGLRFDLTSEEKAAILVSNLVIHFPATIIGSFRRLFEPSSGKWYWQAPFFGSMGVIVSPARPSEDCVAVQKWNSYKSWTCEPKGSE